MTQDTYLAAQGCRRTWAPKRYGTILGGGGAAGPLVGSAGEGPRAGRGRQQQQPIFGYVQKNEEKRNSGGLRLRCAKS